jgi:YggT family protein
MSFLIYLISLAVDIYVGIIILQVIVNWLIIFDVMNVKNAQAQNLIALLKRATDPMFEPIRKYVPPIGGIDLTPLVVILGLNLARSLLFGLLI